MESSNASSAVNGANSSNNSSASLKGKRRIDAEAQQTTEEYINVSLAPWNRKFFLMQYLAFPVQYAQSI